MSESEFRNSIDAMVKSACEKATIAIVSRYRTLVINLRCALLTSMFVALYKHGLHVVEGGEGVKLHQWVSIHGEGRLLIGRNVRFGYSMSPHFRCNRTTVLLKFPSSEVVIGDNCTINNNNAFVAVGRIVLGDWCKTGHDDEFYDSDLHSLDVRVRHTGSDADGARGDILLEENVMVGAHVLCGPATHIGRNSVVGMGSVLKRRDFPPDCVVVGNPARVVGIVGGV
jgi:acetyltransferase-like isoleucine patch superfamily enzyme